MGGAVSKYRAAIFILHASLHRWERHSAALEAKRGASLDRDPHAGLVAFFEKNGAQRKALGRNNWLGEEGDK